MGFPRGWTDYARCGRQIPGTRIVAFKVPLREATVESLVQQSLIRDEDILHPKELLSLIPNLGLVIDLTYTTKYYTPRDFHSLGVAHEKIMVEGHVIPPDSKYFAFRDVINKFLKENPSNDKIIGVHCTHGLNRTGFFVCRYMIEELNMSAVHAIKEFGDARGHKIERGNYLRKLEEIEQHLRRARGNISRPISQPRISYENPHSSHVNNTYNRSRNEYKQYSSRNSGSKRNINRQRNIYADQSGVSYTHRNRPEQYLRRYCGSDNRPRNDYDQHHSSGSRVPLNRNGYSGSTQYSWRRRSSPEQ